VFFKIMAKNLPFYGKGLWRLPDEVIKKQKSSETPQKKY